MEHSAPRRLATWNPERDCWELDDLDLISGLPVVFSETWPSSVTTVGCVAYEQPMWAHHTDGSASSSLLPTPEANTATNGGPQHPDKRKAGGHSVNLQDAVHGLLPTPTANDYKGSTKGRREPGMHRGQLDAVAEGSLMPTPRATRGGSGTETVALLPTPAVNDMGEGKTPQAWDEWTAKMQTEHANGNGHGKSLAIEAMRLLPTPTVEDRKASGGSSPSDVTLTDAVVRTQLGSQANPRHEED